jgi:soluble lytic murein transglycosylase-like protein
MSLVGATALMSFVVSSPAWAPEDPWRVVAQVPIVRGPDPVTSRLVAAFMERHGVQLSPRQFHKITSSVAEASFQEGLDAGLLLSVILSESSFRTDAVSNKGAVGLMQLMPATAAGLAAELDLDWAAARGPELLEDPGVNIQLGAYYLRKLIESYDDDVSMALTAYNMGPGRLLQIQAADLERSAAARGKSAYARRIIREMPNPI